MPKIIIANDTLAPDPDSGKSVLFTKTDGLYVVLESGTVVGPLAGPLSMAAGGALTGTYPNPGLANNAVTTTKIANGAVTGAKLDPTLIDPVAGTAGLRTLGTGAQQAAAGNDPRLSDSRAPSGAASGDLAGSYPAPTVALGAITSAKLASAVSGVLPTTNEKAALAGTSAPSASNKYAVVVGSPSASDVLTWNGSAWAPAAPATSDVLWEWNGTDTSQFDPVPISSTPASMLTLGTSPANPATNKAFATLDVTGTWFANTVAAYRVSSLVLPERFRIRFGLSSVEYTHLRIGLLFFDPTTWSVNPGSPLLGGGWTHMETSIQWILAVGASGLVPPFTDQVATLSFASVSSLDSDGGMLCEWDCTLRPGTSTQPPSVALYGHTLGAKNGDSFTVVADRGRLIGTGNLGGAVPAAFDDASLTGLAIVVNSNVGGTGTGKISRLQVLKAT